MTGSNLETTLRIGLAALLSIAVPAGAFAKADPKDTQFVQEAVDSVGGDMGKQVQAYMRQVKTTPEIIAERKFRATPANVQQYSKGGKQYSSKTVFSSGMEARSALQRATELVGEAQKSADDAPKKYVAETSGKVVNILSKSYNEINADVQQRVNSVRGKLQQMVAIALVINGGGGANAAQSEAAQLTADSLTRARRAFDANDAQTGAAVEAIVRPELPLSRYGQRLFEEAEKEIAEIPELIKAKADVLQKAKAGADEVASKEESYRRGMKGTGSGGTGQVLNAATDALGNHLVMLRGSADMLNSFIKGPGRTIYDVVKCSEAVYKAARALQADTDEGVKLALAREAFDSNVKAARGVGPMAREFDGLLAFLGNAAPADKVAMPGYEDVSAPAAGKSKSGETEKARKKAIKDAGSLMQ